VCVCFFSVTFLFLLALDLPSLTPHHLEVVYATPTSFHRRQDFYVASVEFTEQHDSVEFEEQVEKWHDKQGKEEDHSGASSSCHRQRLLRRWRWSYPRRGS